uniref:Uncharacterized protein n=1 Tax=Utricularia reniformis TaxID=192314 RepID=A0A1Y0B173_9LAMI|nr:hypothetical protein AEK19_MT0908 [Utricularia reniformis]ART31137.1 hypothetical protein AEK19_MT0908 [Utricularia reniformis]
MTAGDRNTVFFHRTASRHKSSNQIIELVDSSGVTRLPLFLHLEVLYLHQVPFLVRLALCREKRFSINK